jgi:hypothetical protein
MNIPNDANRDRPTPFGPWVPGISPDERKAQFRSLAALAGVFLGSGSALVFELRQAEVDDAAAARALDALNAAPSLTRRRLLSVFGAITWPTKPRKADQ